MLINLLPEQVAKMWDVIRFALEESLPPFVVKQPQTLNNILTAALCDKMQVWFGVSEEEGKRILDAIVVTTIFEDAVSGTSNLLIYTLYAFRQMTPQLWVEYFDVAQKYAKSRDCLGIVAYTENEKIVNAAKMIPNSMQTTLVTFPVT